VSVRKVFCEVTDFNGGTLGLTMGQAWHVTRVYDRGNVGPSEVLGRNLRVRLDERVGVVVKRKDCERWWVIGPRDVASIRRLLAKAEAA